MSCFPFMHLYNINYSEAIRLLTFLFTHLTVLSVYHRNISTIYHIQGGKSMNHTNTSAEILNIQSDGSIRIPDKGPITIPMTNDYLFRALLQRNNNVLKGLISALLHLDPKDISSVLITNPIELGKTFEEKDFILDIKLIMNNYVIINLEMQVINEHNWPDRSLNYLCRCFDSLEKGDSYTSAHPVIQIGLLNFTLFPEYPEFYATYKFLNVKNYTLYSDKLCLSVLDLTHIDLATKEDKQYQLDYWAALFKSTTWEDLKMLAQNNEYIRQASETIYQLSQEEAIRQQCEAREDYYRRQKGINDELEEKTNLLKKKDKTINKLSSQNKSLSSQNEILSSQNKELSSQNEVLSSHNEALSSQNEALANEVEMLRAQLAACSEKE